MWQRRDYWRSWICVSDTDLLAYIEKTIALKTKTCLSRCLLSAHRKRYASALARSPMIKVVLYGFGFYFLSGSEPAEGRASGRREWPSHRVFNPPRNEISPSSNEISPSLVYSTLQKANFEFFFNYSIDVTPIRVSIFHFLFQLFDESHPHERELFCI